MEQDASGRRGGTHAARARAAGGDPTARRIGQVSLRFTDPQTLRRLGDPVTKDISAVARAGATLFLACDEAAGLERLTRTGEGVFDDHRRVPLNEIFDLPNDKGEEMDIEGLAVVDGDLWIVGSHALKRKKPHKDADRRGEALSTLANVERERNRFFLGRVPLVEEAPGVHVPRAADGDRRAACLGSAGAKGGLAKWLRKDPHLAPFLRVPCKENGLDIEGIAVQGARVWLGLRGPVLGGHAVVLEMALKEKKPGRLKPRRLDGGARYRKHVLDTAGLGIRDMRLDGEDLLLLVGPTMALQGAARILRWQGAVRDETGGLVPPDRLRCEAELPYARDADHPEGLELWPEAGRDAWLVVHDAPGPERLREGNSLLLADIIRPGGP